MTTQSQNKSKHTITFRDQTRNINQKTKTFHNMLMGHASQSSQPNDDSRQLDFIKTLDYLKDMNDSLRRIRTANRATPMRKHEYIEYQKAARWAKYSIDLWFNVLPKQLQIHPYYIKTYETGVAINHQIRMINDDYKQKVTQYKRENKKGHEKR